MSDIVALSLCAGSDVCVVPRPVVESSAYGKIAELRAIEELIRRGHKVAVPVVDDDGVDLVVDYRVTVQVKNSWRASQERAPGYWYRGYAWSSKRGWQDAEVFLLRGEPDGTTPERWWIVPRDDPALTGHGTNIAIYDGARRGRAAKLAVYEDRWDLLA